MWWETILNNLPIIFLGLLALLFCGAEIIKAIKVWKDAHQSRVDARNAEMQQEINLQEELRLLREDIGEVKSNLASVQEQLENAKQRLDNLTESDMHDIKAWIVVQYHKFYVEQGWIDNYSAETIERRFEDYKKEGGNSYIEVLIDRLRTLPMDPPTDKKK